MGESPPDHFCENCSAHMLPEAKYCPNCGQKRIHPEDRSVWRLLIESIGDFFHFESKFFATMRLLLFRPGFLTNEFLIGRRVRYFHPFKLFLFISFLYFLTSGILTNHKPAQSPEPGTEDDTVKMKGITARNGELNVRLADIHDKVMDMSTDSLRLMVDKYGLNRFVNMSYPREGWFYRFLMKQTLKNRLQGNITFTENMRKTTPKLIFILIPFVAGLLKLFYVRRKLRYFDHIIFSLHFLSFVFLLMWFNLFVDLIWDDSGRFVFILFMIYLFFALRHVYRQKLMKTLMKTFLLMIASALMVGVFFILAASVSFLLI